MIRTKSEELELRTSQLEIITTILYTVLGFSQEHIEALVDIFADKNEGKLPNFDMSIIVPAIAARLNRAAASAAIALSNQGVDVEGSEFKTLAYFSLAKIAEMDKSIADRAVALAERLKQ